MASSDIAPVDPESLVPCSRRRLIQSALAGMLTPAAVAIAVPVRIETTLPRETLLRAAFHSIDDARVIGRAYLDAMPPESSADGLVEALFGARFPASVRELRARLASARDADFAAGRVLALRGWLMAVTEARWCALAVFVGDSA